METRTMEGGECATGPGNAISDGRSKRGGKLEGKGAGVVGIFVSSPSSSPPLGHVRHRRKQGLGRQGLDGQGGNLK